MLKSRPKWEKVGTVGTDIAMILITDPWVSLPPTESTLAFMKEKGVAAPHPLFTVDQIEPQLKEKTVGEVTIPLLASDGSGRKVCDSEAGIAFSTGGDGTYPVYTLFGKEGGLPLAAVVVFQRRATKSLPKALQDLLKSEECLPDESRESD